MAPKTPCGMPFNDPGAIAIDAQGPLCGDAGVEHAQAAGGRIPGVGEKGLASLGPAAVHGPKIGPEHEHFPPYFQQIRGPAAAERQGNGPDGAQIGGNVLTGNAVAAGRALDKAPLLIHQFNSQTVEFRFGQVLHRSIPAQLLPDPAVKGLQLGRIHGIGQAEHGLAMGHCAQFGLGRGPYPLGR